jgi:hypothetical protein
MATLSVLREHLRGDLADIVRIAGERRFENEYLERCVFEGLQQHDRFYTWASLPPAEEQLVLLLAKAKVAYDFALNYALDPKMNVGQAIRDKSSNAQVLLTIAKALREEYEAELSLISADPDEGEILVGTLLRTDHGTRQVVPAQGAIRPQKPVITFAEYLYDPVYGGTVHWRWNRLGEVDVAFMQVIIGKTSPVNVHNGTIIRTLYDVWDDPYSIPTVPSMNQQEGFVSYTILPTGRWYMALAVHNWNRLHSLSETFPLDVENYLEIPASTYVMVEA